jgi:hypothetical protein
MLLIAVTLDQYELAAFQPGEFALHRTPANVREIYQLRDEVAPLRLSKKKTEQALLGGRKQSVCQGLLASPLAGFR